LPPPSRKTIAPVKGRNPKTIPKAIRGSLLDPGPLCLLLFRKLVA
jgi:hypothetical protein